MAAGSSNTNCSAAVCSCPDGCNGMDVIAQTIKSAAMLCDAATGSCSLEIAGLPEGFNSFEVLCGAGECLEAQSVPEFEEVAREAPDREISTSQVAAPSPPLPGLAVVVSDPNALEGCDGLKVNAHAALTREDEAFLPSLSRSSFPRSSPSPSRSSPFPFSFPSLHFHFSFPPPPFPSLFQLLP